MPRPYTANFNFSIDKDTLFLQSQQPLHTQPVIGDTLFVTKGDELVVAQIAVIPEDSIDSIWVKVARDQNTMGWTRECELRPYMVPSDPISEGIHLFSSNHTVYFLAFIFLALVAFLARRMKYNQYKVVHFNDIPSGYPAVLCLVLSASAIFYNGIQTLAPETWEMFYFDPSLNPFGLPWILALFVTSIWLLVIMSVAVVDEVRRCLHGVDIALYLSSLLTVCMLEYWTFTLLPLFVGLPLYAVYLSYTMKQLFYGKR